MRLAAVVLAGLLALLALAPVGAQEQGEATIEPSQARIGERVTLTLEVVAPASSLVELDVAATELGGAEIADSLPVETSAADGEVLYRLRYLLTVFAPGEVAVRPALRVSTPDGAVETMALPQVGWDVVSVLAPGEVPQDIRDLQPQLAVEGAGFAYTRQLVAAGALLAALVLGVAAILLVRRYLRRPRKEQGPELLPADVAAQQALDRLAAGPATSDALPSTYSTIAAVVRRYLGSEYRFPAGSLTAREMEAQMVGRGVHRWQARMATSLLAECDAVAYAGYRPAPARVKADLDMAYQIVGFDAGAAEQAQVISFRRPGVNE